MPSLDWRDSRHWDNRPAPCGVCHEPTHLRSDRGRPAHKVCAETWTDQHTTPTPNPS